MSASPTLPQKPKRRRPVGLLVAAAVVVVAIIVAIVVVASRGSGSSTAGSAGSGGTAAPKTVTIGVADKSLSYWTEYSKLAKSRLDVTVDLVNFSDYSLPNPALKQGQLDINQFQHIQYLANYNATAHDTLEPIGATAVYPLPLYATKYSKASDIPNGATVAIPNDSINEARALLVLQSAHLLSLKDGGTAFSTVADITSHKVGVDPIDASQTANALQQGSVAAAVVNDNYATAAGLTTRQIVVQDDPSSAIAAPYVNIFVTRKADDANPTYLALAKLWHDPAVQKPFLAENPGAVVRDTSAKALQAELAKVEKDAKAAQQ